MLRGLRVYSAYDKSIQCVGFTSKPLVERVKEYLKFKIAISDRISNCNVCKNEKNKC